ncbi:MAG TPA: SDR family NAD(P)-dependent oxidoreductase, partial [Thermoanaerobaculia bacterium]
MTGASRGIGEAIARRLGAEGAKVALAARDASGGSAAGRIASEIGDAGGAAFAVACDVTRADSITAAVAETVRRFGRIDVLVNNAGVGGPTPLDDPDDSRWDAIIATNLTAVFRVTRTALRFLPDGGRILNMSSVVGRFGVAGLSAYSATKHG